MKDRIVRFSKAMRNEGIKRLPYILLIFGLLLLYQGYDNGRQTKENSTDTKSLLTQVADLSEDNRRLQQQGIDLQRKSNDQLACVTKLFVDFINNGNRPSRADAENCSIFSQETSRNAEPFEIIDPQRSSPNVAGNSSSPSPQSAPAGLIQQPNNSQPQQPVNPQPTMPILPSLVPECIDINLLKVCQGIL